MDRWTTLLLVAAGGSLGAVSRFLLASLVEAWAGGRFPWGTFVVNASGCLALGFALALLDEGSLAHPAWKPLVAVGFLGAYTTFSTFGWEGHSLLRDSEWLGASAYLLGSVIAGVVSIRAGILAARALEALAPAAR
jgi:CrcB protein